MQRAAILGLMALAACSDALEQTSTAGQVIAVINSADNTVSFVGATHFSVKTVDMQTPGGAATSAAGHGNTVLVPLGPRDAVAVITNAGVCRAGVCVQPVTVIPLAPGSGATGVEIFDDSIAWVANPNLNTVTRVNYLLGDTVSFPVGPSPRAVVIADSSLFVVNANMVGSQPAGPSSITVRPAQVGVFPSSALGTIALSCLSARYATLGQDRLIYVTCAGHPGAGDGKLSIVDPAARTELAVINGLGESPGSAAFHPSGRLLIASDTSGILEVNTLTRSITRGPGQGVKLDGAGVSALAVDERGRVYALVPGNCMAPGVLHVLAAPPGYNELRQLVVGVCPSAAATVRVF
jgi:hypothetical protein